MNNVPRLVCWQPINVTLCIDGFVYQTQFKQPNLFQNNPRFSYTRNTMPIYILHGNRRQVRVFAFTLSAMFQHTLQPLMASYNLILVSPHLLVFIISQEQQAPSVALLLFLIVGNLSLNEKQLTVRTIESELGWRNTEQFVLAAIGMEPSNAYTRGHGSLFLLTQTFSLPIAQPIMMS